MVERTSPIIQSIKRLDPEKSAYTLVDYSIQFSETVVNVDASDFDILAPGLTGVTISTVSGFSVINLQVATGTGSGEIHLQLRPDHDITDIAGNPLAIDGFSTAEPSQTVYLIERGPTVSIAGVKFDDVNGNGVQDTGEPGLPGWTIFLDQNDNGLLDTGEPSQVTAADGSYAFTDLYSGSYDVAEVFQDGWQQTLPGRGGRDLLRVSEAENGGDAAQGASTPSLSGDGNLVAFLSTSTDLVTGSGGSQNIFVRNRQTGVTTLITDAFDGGPANGNSYDPVLSANGQYVVFVSAASNLVEDDTNNKEDVFLHELATGITERLSEAADGTGGNEHSNSRPDISADGRFVAFSSGASNLVANDDNNNVDVFLLDRQQGTIEIVSVSNCSLPTTRKWPLHQPVDQRQWSLRCVPHQRDEPGFHQQHLRSAGDDPRSREQVDALRFLTDHQRFDSGQLSLWSAGDQRRRTDHHVLVRVVKHRLGRYRQYSGPVLVRRRRQTKLSCLRQPARRSSGIDDFPQSGHQRRWPLHHLRIHL